MDHRALVVLLSLWSSGFWAGDTDGAEVKLSDGVTLEEGESRCAGRLEIEHQRLSTPEEELTAVDETCRQLDCGSAVSWQKSRTSMRHPLFVDITCSESVRLNGTNRCSGRLEVKSDESWSSVCEGEFDQQVAEVVCRELDCGAPSVLQGALYGEVEAPVWSREFQCEGNESHLLECHRSTCSSGRALGLTCSDHDDVRLVGGASHCSGELQVKHDGVWRGLDSINWNVKTPNIICLHLDCGSSVSPRMTKYSSLCPVWRIDSSCVQSTDQLRECLTTGSTWSPYSWFITCSESVRLNGTNRCSGRLEVKSDESWSSVCEGEFDQQVAEVVCRELDCGAPSVLQGALYGEVEAPVWSREFQCEGNESHLLECHRSTCSSGRALGLTCSDHDDVRLVGGASHCSGDLEMNHQREWRPVAVWGGWNQMLADKVCTHLDCGSVVSTNVTNDSPGRSEWMIHYNCVQSKSALRECVMLTDDDETNKGIRVICSESVRLNGTNRCSGRLEVKSDESWSSVCEGEFDQQVAEVVCRELDCGAPSVLQGALYGEVEAPVWSREFQCEGNESHLLECHRSTCSSGRALGLTCSGPRRVRLVGGASRCAGELEMNHQREWRPVTVGVGWNQISVDKVCTHLDCGSAVSTKVTDNSPYRPVWWIDNDCVQSESALRECVKLSDLYKTKKGHEVICSGLLVQPNVSVSPIVGVSGAEQQGYHVLLGSSFTVTCSTEPQYQGGSFHLLFTTSDTAHNYTLPAVNHSAHFLFPAARSAHRGDYTCVYHAYVFSYNFSSESRPLHVIVSASVTDLIIRCVVVLLLLTVSTLILYFHFKAEGRRRRQRPETRQRPRRSTAASRVNVE
ncbi:scavenger receptor cysteine-rich type 1 protein M130-like [Scophthalmus maximus]|uniref:scavenger receptor cysteine-rich type 1 protein M130-like n=1 Tax=Scophthalmus maximus TaxID=52904 RepID=UPI001FA87A81|nr:scavenger receptor cysteine-rich type 1 protein M130-like [Scophthalmus maximus]